MVINANTRIASVLKENTKALDAIISISPKFEKLRNPLLRKIMAGRTSLSMASKLGGCTISDFYKKLEPLGFEIDRRTVAKEEEKQPTPAFVSAITKDQMVELDVRPVIALGSDPLMMILEKVKTVQSGQVLKIINSFEPTPLIKLLQNKGFQTYVDRVSENQVETYFYKTPIFDSDETPTIQFPTSDWEKMIAKFAGKIQVIDVRQLEMPQPMHLILDSLDQLPVDKALFVYHKRIPVFLLPELIERGFDYRINEITDGEVHLLIYKN